MKTLTKIFILLGILAFLVGGLLFDAFYAAPRRITTRYVTLSSDEIGAQLNDTNILFFSDVHYGTYFLEDRLARLVDVVQAANPDVIVFGGDLFDNLATLPTVNQQQLLTQALTQMEAPLGKFAVLGDTDYQNPQMAALVNRILTDADFEIITNRYVTIRNHGSQSINLVGLDSQAGGQPDVANAFTNVNPNAYVLAVCHTPDLAENYPGNLVDYALAGHSHGDQAFLLFWSLYRPNYATLYNRGQYDLGYFTLDVSTGVGTTLQDIRFLANSEVVVYRLKSQQVLPDSAN